MTDTTVPVSVAVAMTTITKQVPAASYDACVKFADLISKVKAAHAAGTNFMEAVPADIAALMMDGPAFLKDVQGVKGDLAAGAAGEVNAFFEGGQLLVSAVLG